MISLALDPSLALVLGTFYVERLTGTQLLDKLPQLNSRIFLPAFLASLLIVLRRGDKEERAKIP